MIQELLDGDLAPPGRIVRQVLRQLVLELDAVLLVQLHDGSRGELLGDRGNGIDGLGGRRDAVFQPGVAVPLGQKGLFPARDGNGEAGALSVAQRLQGDRVHPGCQLRVFCLLPRERDGKSKQEGCKEQIPGSHG